MRLLNLGLTALLLGVVAALAILGGEQAVTGPYGQFTVDDRSGELVAGARAGQTFVADQTGLNRIDVYLGSYQRPNHGRLVLHVKTAPFIATDLATAYADAAQVEQDGFLTFQFRPLAMPAGLPLYFEVEAPQARPGSAVTAMGTREDKYPSGQAVFTGLPLAGVVRDLAFRLYYRPGARRALAATLDRMANGRPAIFGAPQLYLALLLAYWIGLAGLGALVMAQIGQAGP